MSRLLQSELFPSEFDAFVQKSPLAAGFLVSLERAYHHGRKKVCVVAVIPP
jgi:hypothetical protein